jgi:NADP-dependent 3-hydroxy acid dehydrogenase YdfG
MQNLHIKTKNKTVIVTGAAGGMGRECCHHFSQLGWQVLAIDRNKERLPALRSEKINTLQIDIADQDLVEQVKLMLSNMPPVWGPMSST